jgi:cation/acetate symporter
MVTGIGFTAAYIIYFKFINPAADTTANHWLGISPQGIGGIGMLLNFAVALTVSRFYSPPPDKVTAMVEDIRVPRKN